MIETVNARADLWALPARFPPEFAPARGASGVKRWELIGSQKPPGISLLRYYDVHPSKRNSPGACPRVEVEANLTTMLHGDGSAAGSLTPEELPNAVEMLLLTVNNLAPFADHPSRDRWGLYRLDPSQTFRVQDGFTANDYIDSFSANVRPFLMKNRVLERYESETGTTATMRYSKGRSHSIYDKGTQKSLGFAAVRVEARLRPTSNKGILDRDFRPTLDLKEDDMTYIRQELDTIAMSALSMNAATQVSLVQTLIRGGCAPTEAVRLASVATLEAAGGRGILVNLGISDRTARRWQADLRRYLEAADAGNWDSAVAALPALVNVLLASEVAPE